VIVLDNPPVNVASAAALRELAANDDFRAAVLTGAGKTRHGSPGRPTASQRRAGSTFAAREQAPLAQHCWYRARQYVLDRKQFGRPSVCIVLFVVITPCGKPLGVLNMGGSHAFGTGAKTADMAAVAPVHCGEAEKASNSFEGSAYGDRLQ
jgi:hypothetical protein